MQTTKYLTNTILLSLFFTFLGTIIYAQDQNLVVIDKDFSNKQSLLASVPVSVTILEVHQSGTVWNDIYSELVRNTEIINIHLFLKTAENKFEIDNQKIGIEELQNNQELQNLRTLDKQINLFVYGCSLANNSQGIQLLETIEEKTNFNILSSKNCISILDGNFNFDFSSKNQLINTNLILD